MVRFFETILLLLLPLTASYFNRGLSPKHSSSNKFSVDKQRKNERSSRLYVVEHLIDCVKEPKIAEIYGGYANDYCMNAAGGTSASLFRGVGGLLEQALNIGFLVMMYFFIKRSRNGITEFDEEDDDDDVTYESNDSSEKNTRRCPQCSGRGKFEIDGDGGASPICDLCGGTGSILRSTRIRKLGLPASSRQLWRENNEEDDFNI
jgi:hypothetical protein